MKSTIKHIEPKLGEGIYLVKDVAKILNIDYEKTYRWIVGYWGNSGLKDNLSYTFGEVDNRAINFYSLIEFYTFFKLREKGASTLQIKQLHGELARLLNTDYPFAIAQDYYVEEKKKSEAGNKKVAKKFVYYSHLGNIFKVNDIKQQAYFEFFEQFLNKIEFDENDLAKKFFPLAGSRNVVVDPKHQFGQPVIVGTNIKTQTIFSLHEGGETAETISTLYNISLEKVRDAIVFQKAA